MGESMVMGQGNFHIVDNDLKFIITWELVHLPKSTEPHLNLSVDFIRNRRFFYHTYSKSYEYFHSIDVLYVSVTSVKPAFLDKN